MRMPTRREWIKSNWITYPIVGLLLQTIDPSGPDDMSFIGMMGLLMMFGWGVAVLIKLLIWMANPLKTSGMPSLSVTWHMWRGGVALAQDRYDHERQVVGQIEAKVVEANSQGVPVACGRCGVVPEQLFVNASGAYCAFCINGPVADVAYDTAIVTTTLLDGQN
jgi:hypothetical protein